MDIAVDNAINAEANQKRDTAVLRCFVAFLALAAALTGVLWPGYIIKSDASALLLKNLTFARIAVEVRQNIRKIEYGMKNGKDLKQYYGIYSIMRDIERCSSYAEGVYIVGGDDALIYSLTQPAAEKAALRRPQELIFENENDYYVSENDAFYDLFLPIMSTGGWDGDYMIVRLDKEVVLYSTSSLVRTELMQSLIIGLELLGLGLIVISLKRPKTNGLIAIVLISAALALLMDMTMSYVRFSGIAESVTVQSVNRIAQMLQSDIDALRSMGVSLDLVHDVNGWLQKSVRDIPMIHTMSIDSNMRILLTASHAYIDDYNTSLLINYALVFAGLILVSAAVAAARAMYIGRSGNRD